MTASNYRRPRPRPEPPSYVPGLGPDSLVGLDPATANARLVAAEERRTSVERTSTARNLAERVAAAPPPPPPPAVPEPRRSTPPAPEGGSGTRPGRPWREGGLAVPTRRAEPDPPTFTEDDLATLARLLGTERKGESESPGEPDSLRFSGPAPRLRTRTRNPRPGRNLR